MIAAAFECEELAACIRGTDLPLTDPSWAHHLALIRPPLGDEAETAGNNLVAFDLNDTPAS